MAIHVITGASGGGKSTLLEALAARGYRTEPEIGRRIVQDQIAAAGPALPWRDSVAFRDLLFSLSVEAYQAHSAASAAVFFDRSFVEALGYSRVIGAPIPDRMAQTARGLRFAAPVFLCPPWPEIYRTDAERQHDFAFAEREFHETRRAYAELGYRLVDVPKCPVEDRVDFVLRHVRAGTGRGDAGRV